MSQNYPHNILILNLRSVIIIAFFMYCASQNVTEQRSNNTLYELGGHHFSSSHHTNITSLGLSQNWKPMDIFIFITSCSCVLIAIVGLTGNLLVICVLTGSSNRLVYETFCVGLACTDFTYLILTSPITVLQYYLKSWIFGLFWCKVFNFIVQVTVFSTAFMLLGLTTSRFLSVVLPWHNLKMTELQARLSCLAAWSVGILFALPILIVYSLVSNPEPQRPLYGANDTTITVGRSSRQFCREQFSSQTSRMAYQLFVFLSTYVLPFVAIIIMNSMIVYKLQQKNIMERHNWVQRSESSFVTPKVLSSASQRNNRDSLPLRAVRTFKRFSRVTRDSASGNCPDDEAACEVNPRDSIEIETCPTVYSPAELVRLRKEKKQRKRRSKATKLVVLVTTLWCFCWLPTHIIMSWYYFDEANFPFTPTMKVAKLLSQTLSFAASCVNPLVYGIMTGTFKNAISKKLFGKHREVLNGVTASELITP